MKLSTDKMLARKDGHIGWMTFNNPEKRNAQSHEMRVAVLQILQDFEADDDIRVIVMHGAGDKAFVSGADISQFEKRADDAAMKAEHERVSQAVAALYDSLQKPLIAMIQGYCLGGGLQTALSADIRIASDDAQFGIPAGRLGVAYQWWGIRKVVDAVGPAKAKEILFTARRFSAQEALGMGLVNQVAPKAELEATVRKLAAMIADNAPLSLRGSKLMIDQAMKDPGERDMAAVNAARERAMSSEDFKEGRRAFLEKRKPVWRGR